MNVIMDNNTLKANGLYIAALADYVDGSHAILVDDNYYAMPKFVQRFVIAHELGHMDHQQNETVADRHAVKKVGKIRAMLAMSYIFNYFLSVDWTVAAQYLVRMDNLGYPVKAVRIKAPNGRVFSVEDLRPYMSDNYVVPNNN